MRALLLTSLFCGGCVVLAPVVDELPPPGGPPSDACEAISCAELSAPPPATLDPAMLEAPQVGCALAPMTMTLTDDVTLDASSLRCVTLDATFAPSPTRTAETAITLQIVGADLSQFVLHAHSSSALAEVSMSTAHAQDVELHLEGAVRLSMDHTNAQRIVIELAGADPTEPPEALLTSSDFVSLAALGPRAPIRFRDSTTSQSSLQLRSIAFERGQVRSSIVEGELIELLDTMSVATKFASDRMIATGGSIDGSYVERCGSLTLAATLVRMSSFERCVDPIDAQTVGIGYSVIHGDISGVATTITHSVIGGDVVIPRGTLSNDAFCGTTRIEAVDLECPICQPAAPTEVCVESFSAASSCPGLCAATCVMGTMPSTSPMQSDMSACAP